MKKYLLVQTIILALGIAVAWFSVIGDFNRFYQTEGTIFKIANCTYPNPVTTPCFYGAIAIVITFIWSFRLWRKQELLLSSQKYLMWLLCAGTAFAWTNFGLSWYRFTQATSGGSFTCSGVPMANPFLTPCFFGSVLFSAAFITAAYIFFTLTSTKAKID